MDSFYALLNEALMAHLSVCVRWNNVAQRREKTMRKKQVCYDDSVSF